MLKAATFSSDEIAERLADDALIERALRDAVRSALIRHKREGVPAVVMRDGVMVELQPEDIVIPPTADEGPATS